MMKCQNGGSAQILLALRERIGLLAMKWELKAPCRRELQADFEMWARIGMLDIWEMAFQDGNTVWTNALQ